MSAEKTPWFDGSVKPCRVGVYERYHPTWGTSFSAWRGAHWSYPDYTEISAENDHRVSEVQDCPWRGLAQDPKGKKA